MCVHGLERDLGRVLVHDVGMVDVLPQRSVRNRLLEIARHRHLRQRVGAQDAALLHALDRLNHCRLRFNPPQPPAQSARPLRVGVNADHVRVIGGRPRVVRRRRLEVLALVGKVDREPRTGCRGLRQHHVGQRLRHHLAGRIVGCAEQHQLRAMLIEQPREVTRDAGRIGLRQVCPRVGIEHAQAHHLDAGRREGQLPFVVGVGGIQQHDRVAGIEQRAEQIVRQLRAAHADGDVLSGQPRHAENVLLEPRDLLAALQVAERRRVAAALVEQVGVRHHRLVGQPEFLGGLVIDPATAKRDDVGGIQPHGQDVLPLGHLHDLADGGGASDLLSDQRRQGRDICEFHGRLIIT